ncbi:MAG: hypothetical protein QM758_20045 [Armatimonas sp.]
MSLELGPDTERRVREYAAFEGISIEELLDRIFPSHSRKDILETSEEVPSHLQTCLARRYAETDHSCLKHKTLSRQFSGEDTGCAKATPEEYEAELKFWEDYDRERSTYQLYFL